MNTKEKETAVNSIGKQLKTARKILKMTKSEIAEKLCLKTSIIHDIENDHIPNNLELIFFRGYIRAYARLVCIPKEKLQLSLDTEAYLNKYQTISMKTYLCTWNKKKKIDGSFFFLPFQYV